MARLHAFSLVGVTSETGDVFVLEREPVHGDPFARRTVLRGFSRTTGEVLLDLPGPVERDVPHHTPPCLARSRDAPLPRNTEDLAGCFGGSAVRDATALYRVVRGLEDPVFGARALGLAATPRGDDAVLVRVRREAPDAGLSIIQLRGGEGPSPRVRRVRAGDRSTALNAWDPVAVSPSGSQVALQSLSNDVLLVDLAGGGLRRVALSDDGLPKHLIWGHEDHLFVGVLLVYEQQFCLWRVDVPRGQASLAWCEPTDPARQPIVTRLSPSTALYWSGRGRRAWIFGLDPSAEAASATDRRPFRLPLACTIIAVDPVDGWVICEGNEVPEEPGWVTAVGSTTFRFDTGAGARLHSAIVRQRGSTLELTYYRYVDDEQHLMTLDVEIP